MMGLLPGKTTLTAHQQAYGGWGGGGGHTIAPRSNSIQINIPKNTDSLLKRMERNPRASQALLITYLNFIYFSNKNIQTLQKNHKQNNAVLGLFKPNNSIDTIRRLIMRP